MISTNSLTKSNQYPEGRNKFNTLTPAEAKKLSRYLTNRKQPTRTASVLHKPRAPPLVVNSAKFQTQTTTSAAAATTNHPAAHNHDVYGYRNNIGSAFSSSTTTPNSIITNSSNMRCSSSCSDRSFQDHRLSCPSASNNNNTSHPNAFTTHRGNISTANNFRYSTLQQTSRNAKYKTIQHHHSSPNNSDSNLSFRSSVDIIDSAYGSDRFQTMSVDLGNPLCNQQYHYGTVNDNFLSQTRQLNYNSINHQDQKKSLDDSFSSARTHQSESCDKLKSSLSLSTTKVFQHQLSNIKKFLRHIPMRRSFIGTENKDTPKAPKLEESISQISLNNNRSQTPPPLSCSPAGELKNILNTTEPAVNYSNYDEFTRARNRQSATLLRNKRLPLPPALETDDQSESWQLTSLPISYERNLTTVIEEKQHSGVTDSFNRNNGYNIYENTEPVQLIKPPKSFDDNKTQNQVPRSSSSSTASSQSLASSINNIESALDLHQQVVSSFKFSQLKTSGFHHNSQSLQRSVGLPPRMPFGTELNKQQQHHQGTSTGGSSNSSSLVTGTSGSGSEQEANLLEVEENNFTDDTIKTYGTLETDIDTTIISDTSTLNGDSINQTNFSKCAELERTIESLKNKLLSKEKDLTDLQLKQWSSDYLIGQLRFTISKLEKENAQLKSVIVKLNSVNVK